MSNIPEGYRQTEVGVIPVDWEVKKLGVIADVKTGPFGSSLHERDYVDDGTPIITVEHLGEYGVVHENLPMVSDFDRKRLNAYALQPDDIVFSRVGSVDRNSLIKEKENGWLFSGRLLRIRLLNTKYMFPAYLSYYFHQEPTKQRIRSVAVGQTMASLNTEILKNIEVALPPTKEEQQAIASVLSDVDALITALEQIITKKRNIKYGAMQQLLTGKKRLPGFSGEWEEKELAEFGTFRGGSGFPIKYQGQLEGEYPFYKVSDMNNKGNEVFMSTSNNYISENIRKLNTVIIFPKDTIVFAKIGAAIFLERKKILSQDSCIDNNMMGFIIDHSKCNTYFFYSLFHNIKLSKLVSTTALPSLSGNEIGKLRLKFPSLPEQQSIAHILSDMDTEIEVLEQKRYKYRALKQGMMQELLTGKTRLLCQQ